MLIIIVIGLISRLIYVAIRYILFVSISPGVLFRSDTPDAIKFDHKSNFLVISFFKVFCVQ